MAKARHIFIEDIQPVIDGGNYPAKRVVGEACDVSATIFRDGADIVRAELRWRVNNAKDLLTVPMTLENKGLDHWAGSFTPVEVGQCCASIEAWTDEFATWVRELDRKVGAGRTDLKSELAEGLEHAQKIRKVSKTAEDKALLDEVIAALQPGSDPKTALEVVSRDDVADAALRLQPREDSEISEEFEIKVERRKALFSTWYELFPRSQGKPGEHGTFKDAQANLPYVRDMGFDVIYLPPIHPIGYTARKGKNNSLTAGEDDFGSPWAIGNKDGGHKAVDPRLGTIEDFEDYVKAANAMGIEIALDIAFQTSPDHPWVTEHPEFFNHRPDGSIKYAENPPKKYEDIYPLNFDGPAQKELWNALRDVMEFWIKKGVLIFRVDNPHTKLFRFWEWVIADLRKTYPDLIFLAEAFSRPPIMRALAKLGFTQGYSYFTWRNTRRELTEYLTELTTGTLRNVYRPNFFANTPDILPEYLQTGGWAAFKIRLVLAGTMSPSYGIYSGYEYAENAPLHFGKEEYLDSEKYQLRWREVDQPNIRFLVTAVNAIRKANPALQELANIHFFDCNNEQVICYGKLTSDLSNIIIVVVNLNPFQPQEANIRVPLDLLDMEWGTHFKAHDLLTDAVYDWTEYNYVRLDPHVNPAHIIRVEKY